MPVAGRNSAAASAARAMPPPPPTRRAYSRASSVLPLTNSGRASPADSLRLQHNTITGGTKRKERDFDHDVEETNINVVVRCRGRNDREVRENSGVVVRTDGVKGNIVDLSMGPNALSNKTYQFDKVFSPAADQPMLYDEVVKPVLDEVMAGFNCTIFAYGQTGTGKTYTMSGDITDIRPLPDSAGVIPRTLQDLFDRLESAEIESTVKVSFIELYNEDLRDLLSADDSVRLKIYEETKKGATSTLVQGMEETHIASASKGIQLLRKGSQKRQVAATKCNDLSSRSHTIFTVTLYTKRVSEAGEELISAGKLNLVDLAGSENIQRSGAENKRAAEAGLINKSLLTLGRVINALVDKTGHVPYRESKLTRLLQDSLGGRTKTCIIATVSPAKSNLEESISTLDYAFRAKNIRNAPQMNGMILKKTMLREYASEIEKLKGELIASRLRNGVYLSADAHEELVTTSESLKILSDEQREKIETMEKNLRNKVQELFTLTTNFQTMKKDNEATRLLLDGTNGVLEETEAVLAQTRQSLNDEVVVRQAHEETEKQLLHKGESLLSTLSQTTSDISGLHSKLRRRSHLHASNKDQWTSTQELVAQTTDAVCEQMDDFKSRQDAIINILATRMESFVSGELEKLGASQVFLKEKTAAFETSRNEVDQQTTASRDELNQVVEETKALRDDDKEKVGAGLNNLSAAAERISAGIVNEIDAFQTQFHSSYASLGKHFKSTLDDLTKDLSNQQSDAETLRQQIVEANDDLSQRHTMSAASVATLLEEERKSAADERQSLLAQIGDMINSSAKRQEQRFDTGIRSIQAEFETHRHTHNLAQQSFVNGSEAWEAKTKSLVDKVATSRETLKTRLRSDFADANERTTSLRAVTTSVHDSTTRVVDEQVAHLDAELRALDDIVLRIKQQNNSHHVMHAESLKQLGMTVQTSYDHVGSSMEESFSRIQSFGESLEEHTTAIKDTLPLLSSDAPMQSQLAALHTNIGLQQLEDYVATGQTPAKRQYGFLSKLPRTAPREVLLARLRNGEQYDDPSSMESDEPDTDTRLDHSHTSTKSIIFTDAQSDTQLDDVISAPPSTIDPTLRELDPNITQPVPLPSIEVNPDMKRSTITIPPPPLKRLHTTGSSDLVDTHDMRTQQGPTKKRVGVTRTATTIRHEHENGVGLTGAALLGRRAGLRSRVSGGSS